MVGSVVVRHDHMADGLGCDLADGRDQLLRQRGRTQSVYDHDALRCDNEGGIGNEILVGWRAQCRQTLDVPDRRAQLDWRQPLRWLRLPGGSPAQNRQQSQLPQASAALDGRAHLLARYCATAAISGPVILLTMVCMTALSLVRSRLLNC